MRPHVVIVTLLLVATVLVDAAAFVVEDDASNPLIIVRMALIYAQLHLIAIWLALGTTFWLLRAATLIGGIGALAVLLVPEWSEQFREGLCILAAIAAGTTIFALPLRLAGFRWTLTAPDSAGPALRTSRLMQFSLADLFAWTTVVGFAIFIARETDLLLAARQTYANLIWTPGGRRMLAYLIVNAVVALLTAWIVSSTDRILAGLALIILIAVVEAMALSQFLTEGQINGTIFAQYILHALYIALWLAACRAVGIRIVRTQRAETRTLDLASFT